jgi:hypothetical protein
MLPLFLLRALGLDLCFSHVRMFRSSQTLELTSIPLALVALQALSKPEDRAVITSTRNMLRALGSAIGVAVSTAVQYGVMKSNLPTDLPQDLRIQVLNGYWNVESSDHNQWTDDILNAKMKGAHIVFITFVPLVGSCLLGCLLVKDTILQGDAKPKDEKKEVGTSN